ncbi:hypothetical protein BLNAU_22808 [Blattamonas nauphoetae]|uniref:Uncharacterized protein n=1 Tax=Blattamonas nauphoetae TaxID=2049346 RepID=A0ABQ9WV28_9EUKA|nr:hypothetical protein BLNAU_22808 [Blattamonas nauphoetae]
MSFINTQLHSGSSHKAVPIGTLVEGDQFQLKKSSHCFIWRVSPTDTFVVLSEPEKTRFFAYPADRMKANGEAGIGGHVAASEVAQFEQNGENTSFFMMISPNSVVLFAEGSKGDEKSGRTCRVTNFRNVIDLENIGRIQSITTHHAVFHCPFRFSAPFQCDRD